MRRLPLFVVLALHIALSAIPSGTVRAQGNPFSDIDPDHRHHAALSYLQQRGVIEGYPDGTFQPNDKVNRAEAAKILVRSLGLPTASGSTLPFRDTRDAQQWYVPYVQAAYDAGMVSGYPDRTFRPTRQIIRVEGLKMVLKAYRADMSDPAAAGTSLYPDTVHRADSAWYQAYVSYATKKNLIEPLASDRFGVGEELTRGEFAEMIYRLLYLREKNLKEFSQTEEGIASFYGKPFYGRKTSAGTIFRADLPMAAHRTLPFGTIVEVIREKTGQGTLVQIQDRGPFVEGRVIDLNEASFERIASLGTGITPVRLNVRGSTDIIASQEIAKDAFYDQHRAFGVMLDRPAASTFIENGIQVITGEVSGTAKTVTALVKNKEKDYEKIIEAPVNNGKFTLELYTPTAGTYTLNVLPGSSGVGEETITVLPQKVFEKLLMNASDKAPSSLTHEYRDGQARLAWEHNGNALFRIRMGGRSLYVSGATTISLPTEAFREVVGGKIPVSIEGAKLGGINPMTIRSAFSAPATLTVEAVRNEYHVHKTQDVALDSFAPFHNGSQIVLSGTAIETVSSVAWYTLPSGRTGKFNMAPGETIPAGTKFDLRIPVTERGTYIVEINGLDHEAVLNVALYEQGTFPVLENERDQAIRTEGQGIHDANTEIAGMLAAINRSRDSVGAPPLSLDDRATALAQERTRDMLARNYISHTTPDGKTIGDFAVQYKLYGSIAENIAVDNNASAALQGLLRSPAHRAALLDRDLIRIGMGMQEMEDGQVMVTQILLSH